MKQVAVGMYKSIRRHPVDFLVFHNEFKRILDIYHSYSRLLPHRGYKSIAAILLWGSLCRVFPRIEQISLTAGPNRLSESPIHSGPELLNYSSLKSGAGQSRVFFFFFFFTCFAYFQEVCLPDLFLPFSLQSPLGVPVWPSGKALGW